MKIIGLDNKLYHINLSKYLIRNESDLAGKSSYHKRAYRLLKEIYPSDAVCEEIFLEGCSSKLYLDLYLPARNLALEVDGEFHSKYSGHHHGSKLEFARAKKRDLEKTEILELNNITLVRLNYNESDAEWKSKIILRGSNPQ